MLAIYRDDIRRVIENCCNPEFAVVPQVWVPQIESKITSLVVNIMNTIRKEHLSNKSRECKIELKVTYPMLVLITKIMIETFQIKIQTVSSGQEISPQHDPIHPEMFKNLQHLLHDVHTSWNNKNPFVCSDFRFDKLMEKEPKFEITEELHVQRLFSYAKDDPLALPFRFSDGPMFLTYTPFVLAYASEELVKDAKESRDKKFPRDIYMMIFDYIHLRKPPVIDDYQKLSLFSQAVHHYNVSTLIVWANVEMSKHEKKLQDPEQCAADLQKALTEKNVALMNKYLPVLNDNKERLAQFISLLNGDNIQFVVNNAEIMKFQKVTEGVLKKMGEIITQNQNGQSQNRKRGAEEASK